MRFTPRAYQRKAIEFLINTPKAALWASMGSGKSVVALTVADLALSFGEASKILVIAPKRVAVMTWPDEIRQWEHVAHLEYSLITGTAKERKAALSCPAPIHIINFDNVPWLCAELGKQWPYDMVICDEASRLKAHDSVRFKGKPNRKVRQEDGSILKTPGHPGLKYWSERTPRWINMTGTPAPNGLLDLWSQVYLLDQGHRLGKTYSEYRDRYFESDYMGFNWTPKAGAQDTIMAKLQDICLTIDARDYLELPPLVEIEVPIALPPPAMAQYRTLKKEFILEVAQQGPVIAANAAVLSGKLLQAASGFLYTDGKQHQVLHDAKIAALEEMLEDMTSPVLVVYNFQASVERLSARFPQAKVFDDKPSTLADWNLGRIPVMFIHPKSAGHGLSMQDGGHHMIFFDLDWDLEGYQQVIERIGPTRQAQSGRNRTVFIHYLLAQDTLDPFVLDRLRGKATVQEAIKQSVKDCP